MTTQTAEGARANIRNAQQLLVGARASLDGRTSAERQAYEAIEAANKRLERAVEQITEVVEALPHYRPSDSERIRLRVLIRSRL